MKESLDSQGRVKRIRIQGQRTQQPSVRWRRWRWNRWERNQDWQASLCWTLLLQQATWHPNRVNDTKVCLSQKLGELVKTLLTGNHALASVTSTSCVSPKGCLALSGGGDELMKKQILFCKIQLILAFYYSCYINCIYCDLIYHGRTTYPTWAACVHLLVG